ncbi:hypothetical protein CE91St43_29280 [Oscillospiraceae bacterium]|nr:hypothetical protein CE91St43_29280 [Oscillospiraceae bacterium]
MPLLWSFQEVALEGEIEIPLRASFLGGLGGHLFHAEKMAPQSVLPSKRRHPQITPYRSSRK